jgi:hypothetical protein
MKAKQIVTIGLLLGGAFFAGYKSNPPQGDIVTYEVDGARVAFDRTQPAYGLGLSFANVSVLRMIRNGETNRAMARLDTILDFAVRDAMARRKSVDGNGVKTLDRLHVKTAEYRSNYSRARVTNLENVSAEKSDWSRHVDETNERFESEIDNFLSSLMADTNRSGTGK